MPLPSPPHPCGMERGKKGNIWNARWMMKVRISLRGLIDFVGFLAICALAMGLLELGMKVIQLLAVSY